MQITGHRRVPGSPADILAHHRAHALLAGPTAPEALEHALVEPLHAEDEELFGDPFLAAEMMIDAADAAARGSLDVVDRGALEAAFGKAGERRVQNAGAACRGGGSGAFFVGHAAYPN